MGAEDINMELVRGDARIILRHFGKAFIPIGHGEGDAIGFRGTRHLLARAGLGQFKGVAQHAIHTDAGKDAFLGDEFAVCPHEHAPAA